MANHSKHARSSTFAMPSKSSLVKIAATVAAVGLLATGGIVSRNLYTSAKQNTTNQATAFSVTGCPSAGQPPRRHGQRQVARGARRQFHRREVRA